MLFVKRDNSGSTGIVRVDKVTGEDEDTLTAKVTVEWFHKEGAIGRYFPHSVRLHKQHEIDVMLDSPTNIYVFNRRWGLDGDTDTRVGSGYDSISYYADVITKGGHVLYRSPIGLEVLGRSGTPVAPPRIARKEVAPF